jgi:hypothetical protein
MRSHAWLGAAALCAGCATLESGVELTGKPLGEFFDELKAELREVHWRVKGRAVACGSAEMREVDLRDATVTLQMRRIAEASVDGEIRLVALPLAGAALAPVLSGSAARRSSQDMTIKLDVSGDAPVHDIDDASRAGSALAQAVNAAVDGFVRSSADAPCIRLAALKLQFILDVERAGGGGFRIVVPAAQLAADGSLRDVNTLTLAWDRIDSSALR